MVDRLVLSLLLVCSFFSLGSLASDNSPVSGSAQKCETLFLTPSPTPVLENFSDTQDHYHSSFEIHTSPAIVKAQLWPTVLEHVTNWIYQVNGVRGADERSRFDLEASSIPFRDVQFNSSDQLTLLISKFLNSRDSGTRHFALLYEFPSEEYRHEWAWRVHIGISEILHGSLNFTISMVHFPRPYRLLRQASYTPSFLGVPGLVSDLFENPLLKISTGGLPLRDLPVPLRAGEGNALVQLLEDPERKLPVLFISDQNRFRAAEAIAKRLATELHGQALVLYELTEGTDFSWSLQRELAPRLGLASEFIPFHGFNRLYWPRVQFADPNEFHRHPRIEYLALHSWDQQTVHQLRRIIARGMRAESRVKSIQTGFVLTIWDIERLQLAARIEELNQKIEGQGVDPDLQARLDFLTELLSLHEAEQERLSAHLKESEETKNNRERRILALEAELLETQERLEMLRLRSAESSSSVMPRRADAEARREIPNKEMIVRSISELFPEKIVFSQEALRSIRRLNFSNDHMFRRVLVNIAVDLHDLVFSKKEEETAVLRTAFKLRTNLDVATESGTTRAMGTVQSERRVEYEGKAFSGWFNVKYGTKEPNMLRVYLAIDSVHRRIVITHISTHLRNAGTDRM